MVTELVLIARLNIIQELASFFEIPIDRILHAGFDDLLSVELADPERYRRVEAKKSGASTKAQRR